MPRCEMCGQSRPRRFNNDFHLLCQPCERKVRAGIKAGRYTFGVEVREDVEPGPDEVCVQVLAGVAEKGSQDIDPIYVLDCLFDGYREADRFAEQLRKKYHGERWG